jgi:hypothetical protein
MKIVEQHDLLNGHLFGTVPELDRAAADVAAAIRATDWPHGSGTFTIYPESGKARGKGNGVDPIKVPCMSELRRRGWRTEALPVIPNAQVLSTGDLDALVETPSGFIAFEWETGNISSSHRAVNKLLLAMQEAPILGSFLVVPSNRMKRWLTDRIGNIGELVPYFPLWRRVTGISGALRVIAVEHDEESVTVPRIPKRTDGRAAT